METNITFFIIYRSILFGMKNVLNKFCTENQNTYFMFNNFFAKIVPIIRCGKIWWSLTGHR